MPENLIFYHRLFLILIFLLKLKKNNKSGVHARQEKTTQNTEAGKCFQFSMMIFLQIPLPLYFSCVAPVQVHDSLSDHLTSTSTNPLHQSSKLPHIKIRILLVPYHLQGLNPNSWHQKSWRVSPSLPFCPAFKSSCFRLLCPNQTSQLSPLYMSCNLPGVPG